jgi:hypothetical protein
MPDLSYIFGSQRADSKACGNQLNGHVSLRTILTYRMAYRGRSRIYSLFFRTAGEPK